MSVSFEVLAPRAARVSLLLHPGEHRSVEVPMVVRPDGVWQTEVNDAGPGDAYHFRVLGADGVLRDKADPKALATRPGDPRVAIVMGPSTYRWTDERWLALRGSEQPASRPMAIYEVHVGSWRPGLCYRDLADPLIEHVLRAGFTHVEFLPLAEHPYGGSWGYQVTSYYAPTSRFGRPDDLRYLVDRLHAEGIGVLLDWVPAHFAVDDWGMAEFDGEACYEHTDPARAVHPVWGTRVFDYGRPEVRDFLIANALYWIEEFHADGLRVDAVSSMTRLDFLREEGQWASNVHGGPEDLDGRAFLRELTTTVHAKHPGTVLVAEVADAVADATLAVQEGGLGFDLAWDLGWSHDTLAYFGRTRRLRVPMARDPMARVPMARDRMRRAPAGDRHTGTIDNRHTGAIDRAAALPVVLPLSHDDVAEGRGSLWGRMPGDGVSPAESLRALLTIMWATPGKKLLFMGCEFGQVGPWREAGAIDWGALDQGGCAFGCGPQRQRSAGAQLPGGAQHRGILALVGDLNREYRTNPAMRDPVAGDAFTGRKFRWIKRGTGRDGVVAFVRFGEGAAALLCVANLAAGSPRRFRIPRKLGTAWHVVVDSAAASYAGSGLSACREEAEQPVIRAGGFLEIAPESVVLLSGRLTG